MKFHEAVDDGIKLVSGIENDSLSTFGIESTPLPHFVYCSNWYFDGGDHREILKRIFLRNMKKYCIQSSYITMLLFNRRNLITEEKQKEALAGKLKTVEDWDEYEGTIQDDFKTFFIKLQKEKITEDVVWSFFTQKLTNEELKLVAEKNQEHMNSYFYGEYLIQPYNNPDVDEEEMKKSASGDKYLHAKCLRYTTLLTVDKNLTYEEKPKNSESDWETPSDWADTVSNAESTELLSAVENPEQSENPVASEILDQEEHSAKNAAQNKYCCKIL